MPWEDLKPIFRPETVHMGVMKIDAEACTRCGLCIDNCLYRAWEKGDDGVPRLKQNHACFSCFNCQIACPVDAISIVDVYHVDEGFYATSPHPLPVKLPYEPRDAEGRLAEWNSIERTIYERRSVRNFKDKPVPEPLIRRVLEAGRFAPSPGNCQPWRFVVVTDKGLINEMNETIVQLVSFAYNRYMDEEGVKALAAAYEANPLANPGGYDPRAMIGGMATIAKRNLPPFLGAPVVILIAGDSRAIGGPQIATGIAGEHMNLVAKSLGLGACWVIFSTSLNASPATTAKLGLQPPWRIICAVVLGYPAFRQEGIVPREFRPITWFREGAGGPEIEE